MPFLSFVTRRVIRQLFPVIELHFKLCSITGLSGTCSVKRLKKRLQEQYKEHIFFTDLLRKTNIACFEDMAKEIINDRSANLTDKRKRIIIATAKLIKSKICSKIF